MNRLYIAAFRVGGTSLCMRLARFKLGITGGWLFQLRQALHYRLHPEAA